jgi:Tetratricopeptide repeat
MVTAEVARTWTRRRASATPGIALLFTAIVLTSGCATPRVLVGSGTSVDARPADCDDFARGEVRRLGEFVPAALAKGFVVGLALDLIQVFSPHYYPVPLFPVFDYYYLVPSNYPLSDYNRDSPLVIRWQAGPALVHGGVPLGASVIGGPMLARDALRTNDEVYAQAVESCGAPARLARQFGPGDARVATSLETLADSYMRQREYAQAEPLRREAAAIWTALFGLTDSKVARALDDHATTLRHLRRHLEADALNARAAGIRAELAARKAAARPAENRRPSIERFCASPVHGPLFTVCREAPLATDTDVPVVAARP